MSDLGSIVPWAVLTGAGGWFGNAVIQWFKSRNDRHVADRTADQKLEEHRDGLTFQLLEAARIELTELRKELERLRPLEHHLLYFDESLRHLETLLLAETEEDRLVAQRNARAFLNRMKRMQEATGTMRNEMQRIQSKIDLIERGKDGPALPAPPNV